MWWISIVVARTKEGAEKNINKNPLWIQAAKFYVDLLTKNSRLIIWGGKPFGIFNVVTDTEFAEKSS